MNREWRRFGGVERERYEQWRGFGGVERERYEQGVAWVWGSRKGEV